MMETVGSREVVHWAKCSLLNQGIQHSWKPWDTCGVVNGQNLTWKHRLFYEAGVASKMSFGSGRIEGNFGKRHQVRWQ